MIYIETVTLVDTPLRHEVPASEVAINYAVLVIAVVTAIHTVYLLWRAVRRRITNRATLRKRLRASVTSPTLASGAVEHITDLQRRDEKAKKSPAHPALPPKARQREQTRRQILESLTPTDDGSPYYPDHR